MPQNSDAVGPNEFSRLDRINVWHPFTALQGATDPILITKAEGIFLHTHDGKKIIDAISSWWVNLHGHANPILAEAIARQALTLEHVIFAGFTHKPAIELAKNLKSILPSNQEKIFYSDNGSTAVEVALKLSIQYWHNLGIPKRKVIAFEGAYHGDTFGSMSVGSRGAFTNPFDFYLFDVEFIPVPTQENNAAVLEKLESLVRKGDVAAFIYEPLIQAAAGMIMYAPEWLDALLQCCYSYNVLCIADEVFTGFGRTGKYFASDYLSTKPDLMALSKGITGGTLPLGVTSVSRKVVQAFESPDVQKTFFHGHSYTANPLACAAANASFGMLTSDECNGNRARINQSHLKFLETIKQHHAIKEVRCLGTILAIELRTEEGTHYFNEMRDRIYSFFIAHNILLRPLGNVIYILAPYIITDDQLKEIYQAISDFLNHLT